MEHCAFLRMVGDIDEGLRFTGRGVLSAEPVGDLVAAGGRAASALKASGCISVFVHRGLL